MPASSDTVRTARSVALRAMLVAFICALTGCSEYLDRRDTIALSGGDAVMTNRVTHMVDPWPRESANRNLAFNGERMADSFKRYRTGNVTPPNGIGTGSTYQAPPAAPAPNNTTPVGPTLTPTPAPVK